MQSVLCLHLICPIWPPSSPDWLVTVPTVLRVYISYVQSSLPHHQIDWLQSQQFSSMTLTVISNYLSWRVVVIELIVSSFGGFRKTRLMCDFPGGVNALCYFQFSDDMMGVCSIYRCWFGFHWHTLTCSRCGSEDAEFAHVWRLPDDISWKF